MKANILQLALATLLFAPLASPSQVTTTADAGPGSLRYVLSAAVAGATIAFAPGLSGQTIILTGGEVQLTRNVTIDAAALPAGIRINGNHASRIFEVLNGSTVVLTALTITNGYATAGGGILNNGTLTMNRCTVAGNAVSSGGGGGGLYNNLGTLTLNECTVAANSAANGGAGGGIFTLSGGVPVALNQCTVAGNAASSGGGLGGFNLGPANVSMVALFNSIVAGNAAGSDADISANTTTSQAGVNLIGGNARLAALGNYGGPTPTMPPLAGSPAIDLGDDSAAGMFAIDQRGFPRRSGARVDIGAVEVQAPVVTTTADSGPGSLRSALAAPLEAGGSISFATNLSGQTIFLTSGELLLNQALGIDASALPGGVTLSGGNVSRVFHVSAGANVSLIGLTITLGTTPDAGGAIYSAAGSTLHLARCAVIGSSGFEGGALLNDGVLLAEDCTFTGNSAEFGGALQCRAPATLVHCTIYGNNAPSGGGGVFSKYSLLTLNNCIIAGNTAPAPGSDLFSQLAALVFTNANLVQDLSSIARDRPTAADVGPAPLLGDPLLAPLGNYGGPTPTMPPLPGSPAIDAGGATGLRTDQRALPRVIGSAPDLGAAEFCLDNPVVANTTDVGIGSLRYSVFYSRPGATVTFAPNLSGQTILLTHGQMLLDRDLAIDASSLPGGIQINGNHASRLFMVQPNATVVLSALSLTNGLAHGTNGAAGQDFQRGGDGTDGLGGGIFNAGNLTLHFTSLAGHSAVGGAGGFGGFGRGYSAAPGGDAGRGAGGGIYNTGSLLLNQSTLSGNSAAGGQGGHGATGINADSNAGQSGDGQGGGIYNAGTLTLNEVTFSSNQTAGGAAGAVYNKGFIVYGVPGIPSPGANGLGGAIYNAGTLAIYQSTLVSGVASGGPGFVGDLTSAPGVGRGGGIYSENSFSLQNSIVAANSADSAANIFGFLSAGTTNLTSGDPLLAPLGYYGGPTPTRPPLPGSPAIDAGDSVAASPFATDQRGLPRSSGLRADLGAVELQLAAQRFPVNARVTRLGNGTVQFGFTNLLGGSFTVLATTDPAAPADAWSNLGAAAETPPGSGQFQFTDPQATTYPQRFYRLRSP